MQEINQGTNSRNFTKKEGGEIREWGVEWLEAEVGPREVCFCCCCFVVFFFFFKMDEIIARPSVDDSDPVEGKQCCRRERGDN